MSKKVLISLKAKRTGKLRLLSTSHEILPHGLASTSAFLNCTIVMWLELPSNFVARRIKAR